MGIPLVAEPTFTEREPYEKGFAEVFEREIAPKLEEAEQRRLKRLRQGKLRAVRVAIGVVVAAVVMIGLRFDPGAIVLLVIVSGILGYIIWVKSPGEEHQEELRNIIVRPACNFFGDLGYTRKPDSNRFDYGRFRELGVVGRHDSVEIEDLFVGTHRDTRFKMVEGRFERSSGRSSKTVFNGLLFVIGVPRPFSCHVLIGREHGRLGNALAGFFKGKTRGIERVTFDDPEFERRYAVYSDDPAAARQLMAPGFLDTMVALANSYKNKSFGAAFADGDFLLAVPMERDLFELGSVRQSVYDCEEDIHEFLKDVNVCHRVIDYLHGERPGLPG